MKLWRAVCYSEVQDDAQKKGGKRCAVAQTAKWPNTIWQKSLKGLWASFMPSEMPNAYQLLRYFHRGYCLVVVVWCWEPCSHMQGSADRNLWYSIDQNSDNHSQCKDGTAGWPVLNLSLVGLKYALRKSRIAAMTPSFGTHSVGQICFSLSTKCTNPGARRTTCSGKHLVGASLADQNAVANRWLHWYCHTGRLVGRFSFSREIAVHEIANLPTCSFLSTQYTVGQFSSQQICRKDKIEVCQTEKSPLHAETDCF